MSDLCRMISGWEELRLQSIFYSEPSRLQHFPNQLLKDLAGNAFEGSCCAATICACICLVSSGAAMRFPERSGMSQTSEVVPDVSDSDEIHDCWDVFDGGV